MKATPASAPAGREPAGFPRAVPCRGHAFGDALLCPCGTSWWGHQRAPVACPLNARGRNQGHAGAPEVAARAASEG